MKTSSYIQSAVDQAAIAATATDTALVEAKQDQMDGQIARRIAAGETSEAEWIASLTPRERIARNFYWAALPEDVREVMNTTSLEVSETFPEGGPLDVTVAATVKLKSSFASAIGMDYMTVRKSSTARRNVKDVEAVIAFSSGGTMCAFKDHIRNSSDVVEGDTLVRLSPDDECTDFEAVRTGVERFATILEENETVGDLKIGLVPYNYKVAMPDRASGNIPPSLLRAEGSDFWRNTTDTGRLSAVIPLTNDHASVLTAIDTVDSPLNTQAWTRSDLGMHVAALMLDPDHHSYFGGAAPSAFKTANKDKVAILMGDGTNTGCCFTNWPLDDYEHQYVYFYEPYNEALLETCNVMKQNGVKIFTLLLNVEITDPGGAEINNVFARCASGNTKREEDPAVMMKCMDKGACYDISSTDEVIAAFEQIANRYFKPYIAE
jgi:hypothetical protein